MSARNSKGGAAKSSTNNTSMRRTFLFVTVVRHGETDINKLSPRVLQGQKDVPMNALGIQESNALAWRLKKYRLDYIYTSDLSRAKQTAIEIAKYQDDVPVVEDERLREMDLADLAGLTWTKVKQTLKKEDKHLEDLLAGKGETPAQFRNRVINFYGALLSRHLVEPHERVMASLSMSVQSLHIKAAEQATREPPAAMIPGQVDDTPLQNPLVAKTKAPELGRAPSSNSLTASQSAIARQPKIKQRHVLLVTHGGWIEQLMKYLVDDLKFSTYGKAKTGFPKNASVFQFMISKNYMADGDYEWEGRIKVMNCVSHLALLKRHSDQPTVPGTNYTVNGSPKATMAAAAGMISPSPSRAALLKGPNAAKTPRAFAQPSKKRVPEPPSTPKEPGSQRVRSLGW
ncbi:histidine phosphatase superfamily [Entophlyctis helioformis]|nr:histidine phosphatase superfamily [Entophlyctis helioformis]